ncbi:MAG: plastocyanin/azurin family copper-binding protein [Gemmatimonadaceae bacterium]
MRTRRSLERSLAAASILVGALACGGGSGGGGSDNTGTNPQPQPATTVQATPQLAFTPHDVSVQTGGAVTWAFGSTAHTVVFDAPAGNNPPPTGGNPYNPDLVSARVARSAAVAGPPGAPADIGQTSNASVARTFSTAGTFPYHCSIHPQMTGQVTVQ